MNNMAKNIFMYDNKIIKNNMSYPHKSLKKHSRKYVETMYGGNCLP